MSLLKPAKQYVLSALGCGEEPEQLPPPKPIKPVGKLRVFSNWVKIFAVLGLFGYFLFLLSDVIRNYIEDTADPPMKVSSSAPGRDSNEPFYPAIVICNTGLNKTIKLLEAGFGVSSNSSTEASCYPEEGDNGCEGDFPVDKIKFWQFDVRHDGLDPNARRRRRRLTVSKDKSTGQLRAGRYLQESVEDDYLTDEAEDTADQYCLAIDATKQPGFFKRQGTGQRLKYEIRILLAYEKAPDNGEYVSTVGLRGLDMYFLDTPKDLPGYSATATGFENLFAPRTVASAQRLERTVDDHIILGQDSIMYMTMSRSHFIPWQANDSYAFNPSAISAPLNTKNFDTSKNPELNNTADSPVGLTFITLSYSTPVTTVFENTPPSFATLLGSIGGLKSILMDFWAIALLALMFMAKAQASSTKKKSHDNSNIAPNPVFDLEKKGKTKNQIVSAPSDGEE